MIALCYFPAWSILLNVETPLNEPRLKSFNTWTKLCELEWNTDSSFDTFHRNQNYFFATTTT
jgi:hypothetical protein